MRAALTDGTKVVNVIVVDDGADYIPPDGLTLVPVNDGSEVGPGWLVGEDGTFTQPNPGPGPGPGPGPDPEPGPPSRGEFDALTDAVTTLTMAQMGGL